MAEDDRPLLGELKRELGGLVADLREMLALRWELARLEIRADVRSTVRLAIVLAVVLVMFLSALPLLGVCLADALDGRLLSRAGWLLVFGLALLAVAGLAGYLAWRRFRRRFIGLAETLEELHEDALWLQEWSGRGETDADDGGSGG